MGEENKKKSYEVGELDHYLFGKGNHYEIYKKLGSHMIGGEEKKGVYFAVWAPHAKEVSVYMFCSRCAGRCIIQILYQNIQRRLHL